MRMDPHPLCGLGIANAALCERYLHAMELGDRAAILNLFHPDARVSSPLYGACSVAAYYDALFDDTLCSETRLLRAFEDAGDAHLLALHLECDWMFPNHVEIRFRRIDLFTLQADGERFAGLTTLQDSTPIRAALRAQHVALCPTPNPSVREYP